MSIAEMTEYESYVELKEMYDSGAYPELQKIYEYINDDVIPYQTGIIYMIWCNTTNKGYVGHTKQGLKCRSHKHKNDYKRYTDGRLNYRTYFDIIKHDNYEHSILEEFKYQERTELFNKEALWMDKKTKEGVTLVNKILMKNRLPDPS